MRTLHVLAVVVVTGFLMGGCSKGAEGGGSGDVSVPNELLGSYSGTEDSDHVLVVGPMGMKSEGIICSKNIAFESFDPAGENKWKFTGEYNGVLVKTGEDLNISVDGDDCFAEGIAGVFKKATENADPAGGHDRPLSDGEFVKQGVPWPEHDGVFQGDRVQRCRGVQ